MIRIDKVVIQPEKDICPRYTHGNEDCAHCEFCKYIGTFGGEFYVDCIGYENNENNENI